MVEDTDPPACLPHGEPSQLVLASQLEHQTALAREQEKEELSKELASFIHISRPQSRQLPAVPQLCDWLNDEEVSDSVADIDLPLLFIDESEEEEECEEGGNISPVVFQPKQTKPDRLKDPKIIRPFADPHKKIGMETQQKDGRMAEPLKKRCGQLPNAVEPWIKGCTGHATELQLEEGLEERPSSNHIKGNDSQAKYENKVKSSKNTFISLTNGESENDHTRTELKGMMNAKLTHLKRKVPSGP